jgi:adenylate cyclase
MTRLTLGEIRHCLEGTIPAVIATVAADGTPNVAYISQACYADEGHVALSFQFFNKTRANILANPYANLMVLHPQTVQFYRLHLRYVRTETEGPLFESMKAQLAGIASHTGMANVFKLLGSDIYAVQEIEAVEGSPLPTPPPRYSMLSAVRRCSEQLSRSTSLDEVLNAILATLTDWMGVQHAMVLMADPVSQRLYTVASCGYATSGVGSEIGLGQGVIGVAARERTPVRIQHMATAYLYSSTIRNSLQASAPDFAPEVDIPYPGLPAPHSQLAVPIVSAGRLLGVVFVESPHDMQFGFEDEDVLVAMAGHLGAAIDLMQSATEPQEAMATDLPAPQAHGAALHIRHYPANDSIFIGDDYLIKGVAGAIFWKLVRNFVEHGRTTFSNRELRLDNDLGLPDVTDNLEARLLLLQRRLKEHGPLVRIEKTGRGRFQLVVQRPLTLQEVS